MQNDTLINGRYAILKKLGEGGKGEVYKAMDQSLDRVVAIKVLKTPTTDRVSIDRFMQEAKISARLVHPNIASVFDISQEDGKPVLVMEYVDGKSMRSMLEDAPNRRLPLNQSLQIIQQLAGALAYAHSNHVLHRDIKPENVMFTKEGVPKLMDFGLARISDRPRVTSGNTILGTPAYIAPENVLGRNGDHRSDLYSLGVVFYEMVCGRPPFDDEDSMKLIYRHVNDIPPKPSEIAEVPSNLEAVILKLMQKNPEDRYRDDNLLLDALYTVRLPDSLDKTPAKHVTEAAPRKASTESTGTGTHSKTLTTFVGRGEELDRLKFAIDSALGGSSSVIGITGVAGVGKSRLCMEAADYAALRGFRTLRASVLDGQSTTMFIWTELIRRYAQKAPTQLFYKTVEDLGPSLLKIVPELSSKLGHQSHLSQESDGAPLGDSVVRFFDNASREEPLLIEIDDIMWADKASLDFLKTFCRSIAGKRIVILLTYRSENTGDQAGITDVVYDLRRDHLIDTMKVDPLTMQEAEQLVRIASGKGDVARDFYDVIYRKTSGNPFFIEEIVKSLKSDHLFSSDAIDRSAIENVVYPVSIKTLMKRKMEGIDADGISLLQNAALLGSEADFDILVKVLGIGEEKALDLADSLERGGLIVESEMSHNRPGISFKDRNLWEYLNQDISSLKKRRMHLAIALQMESAGYDKWMDTLQEMLSHFRAAHDVDRTIDYSMKLGKMAEDEELYATATAAYSAAVDLLREKKEKRRLMEAINKLITVYSGTGEEALRTMEALVPEMRKLAEELDDKDYLLACTLMDLGYSVFYTYDIKMANEATKKIPALMEAVKDKKRLMQAAHMLGSRWAMEGKSEEAVLQLKRVDELQSELPPSERVEEMNRSLRIFTALDVKIGDEVVAMMEKEADKQARQERMTDPGLVNAADFSLFAHLDLPRAIPLFDKAAGNSRVDSINPQNPWPEKAANALILTGDFEEAERLSMPFLVYPDASPYGRVFANAALGQVNYHRGNMARAEKHFSDAYEIIKDFPQLQFAHVVLGNYAVMEMDMGNFDHAAKLLEKAYQGLGDMKLCNGRSPSMHIMLADLLLKAKTANPEKAEEALNRMRAYAESIGEKWTEAFILEGEGHVASAKGEWKKATESLTSAAEHWRSLHCIPFEGQCLYQAGLAAFNAGDSAMSSDLLNKSLDIFTRLKSKLYMEKILARKQLLTA